MCTTTSLEPGSLYSILGVSIKATSEEIRNAYLRLARLWHPDRHRGSEIAKHRFQQVQSAYEVLSNDRARSAYDLQWLDQLAVETYLDRFKDLILTANGLGMSLSGELYSGSGGVNADGVGGSTGLGEGEWGTGNIYNQPPIKA